MLRTENDEKVLYAVSRAIGSLKRERTLKFAKYLFLESETLKEWADLICAKEESDEKAQALYQKVLRLFNRHLVYAALFSVRDGNFHGLGPELIEITKSDHPLLQIEAIYGLREYPNGLVIPVFLDILEEVDISVQKEILKELAIRKQNQLLHVLHRYLDAADTELITTAVLALGMLRNEQSVPQLIAKYHETDNANLQATIIRALGGFKSDKVINILLDGLKSPIGRIRANAIDSLIQKKHNAAMPLIEPMLQDQNNRVRANAALALWKFGNQNIWRFMEEMISSADKWMRLSAIWALGEIGGEDSLGLIMKHMDDTDYDVKLRAILTLNRMDSNLLNLLGNMLEAKDDENEKNN
jgi:HEAT repeat protein